MVPRFAFLSLAALVLSLAPASVASAQPGYSEAPPANAYAVAPPRRSPPKLAIGLGLGHYWQEDEIDADEVSLIGRLRLNSNLFLGVEVAQLSYDAGGDSGRLAAELGINMRSLGLARTYVTLGGGALYHDVGSQSYVEAGLGLDIPLGRNLSLIGEARLASAEGYADENDREISARWRGMLMARF